jgi:HlyD family secretion protein
VDFREGDQVKAGDVLIRLEAAHLYNEIAKQQRTIRSLDEELANLRSMETLTARQFEAARAKAAAELQQAREEVDKADKFRTSDVHQAEVELGSARADETVMRRLLAAGAVPSADLDKAVAKLRDIEEKVAKARLPVSAGRVQVAQRLLEQAEHDGDVKGKELALKCQVKQGEVAAARIELANSELELRQAVIRAPIAGVVIRGDIKLGDVLEPGKPVVEIAEQTGFLFEALVPSQEVGDLRVGMPVRLKLDAYDYQRYGTISGTVCYIAPDSGVTEAQPKACYLVRIALEGDEIGRDEIHGRVKLGMSGQADIVTERQCLLSIFMRKIHRTISLG